MNGTTWKSTLAALAAAAVVTGVAGCADGGAAKRAGSSAASPGSRDREEATKAVRAAYEKTAAAGSAKVETRVVVSGGRAAGSSTFTGVRRWGPSAADLKVIESTYLAAVPGAPAETRVVTAGGAAYTDVGAGRTALTGGRRWLKVDLEGPGAGGGIVPQLTAGLSGVNQDPAEELGLLAKSSTLRPLGAAKDPGARAYGGDLPGGRHLQVWIGADGYPRRTVLTTDADGSRTELTTTSTDYGTEVDVRTPPADDTIGFAELLKRLAGGRGGGGGRG
ncbi:hypothetical protein ACFQ7A_27325 [Streptomyces sp. NPDC056528]|uniref:hypothetical protein n=1 Tax=Streptomyces sp. NPDC056528 TaxID=3345854 RepID=UPI0036841ED3